MNANPAVTSARAQRLLNNSPCARELEATLCCFFMIDIPDRDELERQCLRGRSSPAIGSLRYASATKGCDPTMAARN
jgi:hypothetical protein